MSRLAGLLLALALTASACQGSSDSVDPGASLPTPTVTPTYGDLPASIDYVAMGDSFTAGPFISTMRTDPQGCARSKSNYPAFLAGWLGVATYTDVSCSAAVTKDLYGPQRLLDGGHTGRQLDALSAETDLVTLGIGGNDFNIYSGLVACQDEEVSYCPIEQLQTDARKVQGHIAKAVRSIKKVAPEAVVFVVGYPDIMPTEGTCPAVGVSAEVLAPVTEVAALLNASLREGAEASGATYIDMEAASEGHDVCAKGRAWINGPRFRAGVAAPFHPKINGMRAVAGELYREITGADPEVTEYAEPDTEALVLNAG